MKLNKENQLLFIWAELGLNKIHTFKSDPQLLSFQNYFCPLSGSKNARRGAWGVGFVFGHCLVVHKVLGTQRPVTLFGNGIFADDEVKIGWALNQ